MMNFKTFLVGCAIVSCSLSVVACNVDYVDTPVISPSGSSASYGPPPVDPMPPYSGSGSSYGPPPATPSIVPGSSAPAIVPGGGSSASYGPA